MLPLVLTQSTKVKVQNDVYLSCATMKSVNNGLLLK